MSGFEQKEVFRKILRNQRFSSIFNRSSRITLRLHKKRKISSNDLKPSFLNIDDYISYITIRIYVRFRYSTGSRRYFSRVIRI
jgi:hypothetical protein